MAINSKANTIDIHVTVDESSIATTYEDSEIKNSVKLLFEFTNYGFDARVRNIIIVPINPEFRTIPFNFTQSILSGKSRDVIEFNRKKVNLNKIYFEFTLENSKIKSNEVNIG